MKTLVFIPAWNEEASVGAVVRALRAELPEVDVLVCDDGSSDRTAAEALAAGAAVASLPFHVGIGAAVHCGYLYAARHGYTASAHCDADGQHRPEDVRRLLAPVWAGEADLVLGSRYLEGVHDAASAPRALGITIFRALLSWQAGTRFTDTTSGLRAAGTRAIALYAHHYAADFPELEALQRAVKDGLRVLEVPIQVLPRCAGRSQFTLPRACYFVWRNLFAVLLGLLPARPEPGARS